MPGLLRLLMVIRKYPPGGFLTIISISRSYRNVNDEICTLAGALRRNSASLYRLHRALKWKIYP